MKSATVTLGPDGLTLSVVFDEPLVVDGLATVSVAGNTVSFGNGTSGGATILRFTATTVIWEDMLPLSITPVSYTHLKLPTILIE